MRYYINQYCAQCGACLERCPVEAISSINGIFRISSARCIGCGMCRKVCRSSAIQPLREMSEIIEEDLGGTI